MSCNNEDNLVGDDDLTGALHLI